MIQYKLKKIELSKHDLKDDQNQINTYLLSISFNDIDGLASLIEACDQVVSVSNTTVHIAGSIGKETYLMLPQGKGRLWYWSKEKEQSIWYKSVQVIEQTEIGCWKSVVENIKNKLNEV